jgi:hypothetical protein
MVVLFTTVLFEEKEFTTVVCWMSVRGGAATLPLNRPAYRSPIPRPHCGFPRFAAR